MYWFQNDDAPELYCASADWLERNLLRRVETCFPILDPELAERAKTETLDNYLLDNLDAWDLQSDGVYARLRPGEQDMPYSAQSSLLAKICGGSA